MGEYTVEQVNRQAQKELRSGAHSQSYGMLKAYAALLERQANAAGEYVANIDRYGGVIWTKGTPPHGTKLFTHPPAQASAAPDVPLPGVVWNERTGAAHLIKRGTEDDFCAEYGCRRVYLSAAPQPPKVQP